MNPYDTFEVNFQGRKPSKAQIIKALKQGKAQGHHVFDINWGENWLRFECTNHGGWDGRGWIRNLGGDDIAQELNKAQAQQFVDNHFQFITIR